MRVEWCDNVCARWGNVINSKSSIFIGFLKLIKKSAGNMELTPVPTQVLTLSYLIRSKLMKIDYFNLRGFLLKVRYHRQEQKIGEISITYVETIVHDICKRG